MTRKQQATRQCYAATLGGCQGPLSREHFVSNAILKQFEKNGHTLNVQGLPLGGTKSGKPVSASSLNSKVLCKHHNSLLSKVDTAGERFVMEFFRANEALAKGTQAEDKAVAIDGTLVERWLLKYACGLISSGNAGMANGTVVKKPPPEKLLQVLFGSVPFGGQLGLYAAPRGITSSRVNFSLTPTWKQVGDDSYALSGVELVHYGMQNLLRLVPDYPQTEGIDFSKSVFRPDYFEMYRPTTGRRARIELKWPFEPRGNGLDVRVVTQADAASLRK